MRGRARRVLRRRTNRARPTVGLESERRHEALTAILTAKPTSPLTSVRHLASGNAKDLLLNGLLRTVSSRPYKPGVAGSKPAPPTNKQKRLIQMADQTV